MTIYWLFLKLLRDLRWPLFWVGLLLMLFEVLWTKVTERITIELLPAFQQIVNLKTFAEIIFQGQGKLIQTIMGGDMISLESPRDMLTIGYVHPTVQTIFCIWAIGRASGALAGEIDRGTMELLLAQPIARWQVVAAHFLVDLVTIPVLCLCMILGTWIGLQITGLPGIPLHQFWGALVNGGALIFAVSGSTMAVSAMGQSRWRVLSVALGFVLVQFIFNVLAQLWKLLTPYRPLNLFYYYQPQPIILQNKWTVSIIPGWPEVSVVAVLIGVGLVGYLIAWRIFARRDIPAPL
jgi:ABC-2 type transport system permease protein